MSGRTQRKDVVGYAAAGIALTLSAMALASGGINPGAGSPGWEWGRLNCGPLTSSNCTRVECEACCQTEYEDNWHTTTWLNQCKSYCGVVNWSLWCQ